MVASAGQDRKIQAGRVDMNNDEYNSRLDLSLLLLGAVVGAIGALAAEFLLRKIW